MNASMVRFGGIAIFVMFVLSLVGGLLVAGSRTGGTILGLISTALLLFALWTTKGYFNAKNYTRADLPIMVIMATYALQTVIGIIAGTGGGLAALSGMAGAKVGIGLFAIIGLVILLLALVFGIIFALRCMDFGKSGGGGLWKAIGILYLIGLICFVVAVVLLILAGVAGSAGLAVLAATIILIGGLVLLGALICHGIGLITGAGKLSA